MKKFEYREIVFGHNDVNEIEKTLNLLGQNGWELVTSFHRMDSGHYNYYHFYFKKELKK
jgi:hypothetical protein